jgi:hypothetical protein
MQPCPLGKRQFICRKEAKLAAKASDEKGGKKKEYRCKICPAWHVGFPVKHAKK